jgi:hypothetical protein
VPTETDSVEEQVHSDGVPDLLQSTAANARQTDSHAESSAAGFSTPQHSVPIFDHSTHLQ